jgi:hypothetical protein
MADESQGKQSQGDQSGKPQTPPPPADPKATVQLIKIQSTGDKPSPKEGVALGALLESNEGKR